MSQTTTNTNWYQISTNQYSYHTYFLSQLLPQHFSLDLSNVSGCGNVLHEGNTRTNNYVGPRSAESKWSTRVSAQPSISTACWCYHFYNGKAAHSYLAFLPYLVHNCPRRSEYPKQALKRTSANSLNNSHLLNKPRLNTTGNSKNFSSYKPKSHVNFLFNYIYIHSNVGSNFLSVSPPATTGTNCKKSHQKAACTNTEVATSI